MSSLSDKTATVTADPLRDRLRAYYTRYYRDALGIPGWRDLVEVRLADAAYEALRLARLERALDRPVHGLRLLNLGCGTGGFNVAAEAAGALAWGVDLDPEAAAIARARVSRERIACAAAESLPFRSHYKLLWIPGLPKWLGRAYLAARGRPHAFLATLSLTTIGECTRVLVSAGVRTIRVLEGDVDRAVGGPLWPLVRFYYRLSRVRPSVELVAIR